MCGAMDAVSQITNARRAVLKIGSALLVDDQSGNLREDWLKAFIADVAMLKSKGAKILIVSSGSIALGRRLLGLGTGTLSLEQSQGAAAVGQIRLARAYEESLVPHNLVAAQVLLTLEDSENRRRYLNARATVENLLDLGVVPIINENDTIATDEIRFGDNDRLAAQVAVMTSADLLILFSDVDGLHDSDPRQNPNAKLIERVEELSGQVNDMAEDAAAGMSKGGMKTKLMAARTASAAGCTMIIAKGNGAHPVAALLNGGACTLFSPRGDPKKARRQWIGSMKPKGSIVVDAGAAKALCSGKSLLPAGVKRIDGEFGRGEPVSIHLEDGEVLGQGLARYTSNEAKKIHGKRSGEISEILGYPARSAMIHRDDMAL